MPLLSCARSSGGLFNAVGSEFPLFGSSWRVGFAGGHYRAIFQRHSERLYLEGSLPPFVATLVLIQVLVVLRISKLEERVNKRSHEISLR